MNPDVQEAIRRLVLKRKGGGTVSTGHVISELRSELDVADATRDLEDMIAEHAIRNGLQVAFDADRDG